MKSFAFFATLTAAITASANPNPLEKRQDQTCLGICGLNDVAVTLSAPVSVSTVISLPIVGPVATLSLTEDFTTTISPTCIGTSCTCSTVVDTVPTIPVTLSLAVPTVLTSLGIPVPTTLSLGLTGTLAVPTADVGLCAGS